ncbi:MAG: hypothetical protein JW953_10190 [Anaerolineae bacterium]|nr:hypothetical protein [Anaerolineae bacterium]
MIDFMTVEQSVKALKAKLVAGEMGERAFEESLLGLIDVAEDGYYWMFGHESETWYRHDGEKWLPDDPGEMFIPLPEPAVEQNLPAQWRSINWGWFIASLIILAVIGGLVYYSTL